MAPSKGPAHGGTCSVHPEGDPAVFTRPQGNQEATRQSGGRHARESQGGPWRQRGGRRSPKGAGPRRHLLVRAERRVEHEQAVFPRHRVGLRQPRDRLHEPWPEAHQHEVCRDEEEVEDLAEARWIESAEGIAIGTQLAAQAATLAGAQAGPSWPLWLATLAGHSGWHSPARSKLAQRSSARAWTSHPPGRASCVAQSPPRVWSSADCPTSGRRCVRRSRQRGRRQMTARRAQRSGRT